MIIISLMGGLGNQMFQYATAKQLSIINNTELRIDGSNFSRLTANKEHTLQLSSFNIAARQATAEEIRQLLTQVGGFSRMMSFVAGLAGSSPLKRGSKLIYREPHGSYFKPEVLGLEANNYLIGYFNSYKYFAPVRDILIAEYMPREKISAAGQILARQIGQTNSVGIHIRRGDYVSEPGVYKCIEGIITDRYYRNAVDHIASRVSAPHFYVFSNDMPWVRENFRTPYKMTCVDINPPQRGFEDLWIMSRCKHNILAGGSTFSWWAAYLNPNAGKIVVRTENVSNDPKYNHPEDYFPPEWVSVKS
jgi:hypothetical protein